MRPQLVRDLAAAGKEGSEEGIAGLLRGAEEAVIVWGERVGRGDAPWPDSADDSS